MTTPKPSAIATVTLPRDLADALIAAGVATPHGADDTLFPLTSPAPVEASKHRYAAPGSAVEKAEQVYAAIVQAGINGVFRSAVDSITGSEGSSKHALDTLIRQGRVFRVGKSIATRYYATCHRAALEADLIARTLGTITEKP
ncbi:hypothetical protein [Streptosporangium sp. NPDC051022]|uniref:hypothetical protein n=1 Tax=Streptosporangium sp. NPDC051022 TaxID=3155752 RepID=UPI003423B643